VTDGDAESPVLVLGPMLRHVGETEATVWVETDRACQVEILGRQAATFEVAGHHYGLVVIDGLEPGSEHEYQVALDGTVRWPALAGDFPPSLLRTLSQAGSGRTVRLAFGSCRVTETAAERGRDRGAQGRGAQGRGADADALAAAAAGLRETPRDRWPDALLLIGDQVYADNPGPATRRFIGQRRDPAAAPGEEAADFEEYCALYREAWTEPAVRWLLSVIPTGMIFDDHDVHDDWNTSAAWREKSHAKPWWRSRIEGAFVSYWIYQHLGNLSPAELDADEVWQKVRQPGDAAAVLRDVAHRADERAAGLRWSFSRTFGTVRVVMIDSRSRRVLESGERLMADEAEWRWVIDSVRGGWEHVVLATSVPLLLPRGIHALEAWSEAVCDGVWGSRFARFGERLRQKFDLEHWPAFGRSFAQFEQLLIGLAAGEYGKPPASVTVISGDVHHSYLTAVDLPAVAASGTAVYQAVCSPFRQWVPPMMRRAQWLARSTPGGLIGTVVARLAGARDPVIRWRVTEGPWYENMISVLEFHDCRASVRFDRASVDTTGTPRLTTASETRLS
jgi:hypothetical protein